MSYLFFLGIGLGTIWWGIRTTEEVARLTAAIVGALLLIWGLCLTPQSFLLIAEVLAILAIFRICVRCCKC
ncbi:hypothetical protein [Myxosarcina sp. GI1]|uniref:hypothetical protein n=1 Tax=Myxosarcina sp. GI1 TaxID=1541065 RepID=UPI00056AD1ED|nr:hypothetical protein [Myxosarcina sp. GI1]